MVKKKFKELIDQCQSLSFTSDIWTGPTESFISLTVHGINKEWDRVKHVLCVQPFSGNHNFKTIGGVMKKMLNKWEIPLRNATPSRRNVDPHSPLPKRHQSFFDRHSQLFDDDVCEESILVDAALMEMHAFNKQKCIGVEEDPLLFWKMHEKIYPALAKLARRFLSAPATSQPSEQVFSVAGDV